MKKRFSNQGGILQALYVAVPVLLFSIPIFGQKKTLGVGVATPNPNAAMHVESPTNDQGFILPRVTTAQRTATSFTSVLSAFDNGLLVYDTDLNSLYVWNGTVWTGAAKLVTPFADSSTSVPYGKTMFALNYKGEVAGDSVGVAYFKNSGSSNLASVVTVSNAGNSSSAGVFEVTNISNPKASLVSTTPGSGPAIFAENQGTSGGPAAHFLISQASNYFPVIEASSMGSGSAIQVVQDAAGGGTGPGIELYMENTLSSGAGIWIDQRGADKRGISLFPIRHRPHRL